MIGNAYDYTPEDVYAGEYALPARPRFQKTLRFLAGSSHRTNV